MKFKVSVGKGNFIFMTFLIVLCLVTCVFWFILDKYIIFSIYLLLTIILAHMYYVTSYTIDNKKLIVQLGFVKIKIDCQKIKNVKKEENNKVKIEFKKLSLNLYPLNQDLFIDAINKEKKIQSKGKDKE